MSHLCPVSFVLTSFHYKDPDSPVIDDKVASLQRPNKTNSKKPALLRDLTAGHKSEEYRMFFRLPQDEILDGKVKGEI